MPLETDCHPPCERFFPCSPVFGTRASCSSSVDETCTITIESTLPGGVFFREEGQHVFFHVSSSIWLDRSLRTIWPTQGFRLDAKISPPQPRHRPWLRLWHLPCPRGRWRFSSPAVSCRGSPPCRLSTTFVRKCLVWERERRRHGISGVKSKEVGEGGGDESPPYAIVGIVHIAATGGLHIL